MTQNFLRRNFIPCLIFGSLLALNAPVWAASYFKCVGPDGSIIFSDTECPDEAEIVTEKTLKPGALNGRIGQEVYNDGNTSMSLDEMIKMRGRLAEGLASLSTIKMAITEYQAMQADWPHSLQDIGFDSERMNSQYIENVGVGQNGAIIANLRENFGEGKIIVLTPRNVMDGTQLEWDCAANFSPLLMQELSCESRKIYQ